MKKYDANKIEKIRDRILAKDRQFDIQIQNGTIIATYVPYNLEFVYIPKGKYNMGLSLKERQQAKEISTNVFFDTNEMVCKKDIQVSDFLITRTPVINSFANKYINKDYFYGEDFFAAYLKKEEVDMLCQQLGLRLPTEIEWEYSVRAGSADLFTFGTRLPEEEQLEKWLSLDFSKLESINCNDFGLYGIYTGEWCSDHYKENDASFETQDFVIKGGGAYFWPWQDEEWVWCISAMRMSSNGLIDGECGCRLVFDL